MSNRQFRGTGVALVTPFTNGSINYDQLENIINHTIDGGVDFLVSLGTTGEAVNLSSKECRAVLDFTIKINDGRVPLVAGLFGHNYTQKLVNGIKRYNFDGIDGIMSSSPGYIKPSQEGIYQHYMALGEVAPRPMIIYNVPGRTSSNIAAETTLRLAEAAPDIFVAVKEASGNLEQAMQVIKNRPDDFTVLSGDDVLTVPMAACGGDGAISVIANAFPSEFSDMVRAALSNDFATANHLNELLLDIHPMLYVEGNPTGIKAAMEIIGLCSREMRIPLTSLSESVYQKLATEIKQVVKLQREKLQTAKV
ncbi:MAG: 4-hydroxy-tetrahydrodipicolinate synthase [Saprospiraceae bacterium]